MDNLMNPCGKGLLIKIYLVTTILLAQMLYAKQEVKLVFFSMDQAITRALKYNNLVRAAEFEVKRANWQRKEAWTTLLPNVAFNTRFTWIDDSTFALRDFSRYFQDPNLPFRIPQTVFQKAYFSSLDVYMPIYDAGLLNGISIARLGETMAEHLNESTKRNIIFQVISGYLNVLKNQEILKLQKDYLELSRLNYEKAERLHNAGRYSKAEVLRWQVEYQQQKSIMVNSESALRSSRIILSRLLNLDKHEFIEIDPQIPRKLQSEGDKLEQLGDLQLIKMIQVEDEVLIQANAALSAAKSNEEISELQYNNSYNNYIPTLSLTYSYAWRENNTIVWDDYSPQTLMINLNVPLFTGFRNYSNLKSSYYNYKKSQENFSDQLQNVRLLLTEAVNKIINLKTQKELSKVNVTFTEHNYRVVEQQKEQGLVSNIDFIDAKLNLQRAMLDEISNRYDIISSMVELYYLLGKLDSILL